MTGQHPVPPGWYPDANGQPRWWDGAQWTAHTAGPPVVAAPAAAAPLSQVAPGTTATTRWIWWIALLPFVVAVPMAFYLVGTGERLIAMTRQLVEMAGQMGDELGPEVTRWIIQQQFELAFSPLYFLLLATGVIVSAIVILFAYFDWRDLGRMGYVRPFHWAWAFLSTPLVYLIGRTVVVRRRGGRGSAPLWVFVALEVAFVLAVLIWSVWFSAHFTQVVFHEIPGLPS